MSLSKCGSGGESWVLIANVVGGNLVIKCPKYLEDVGNAMMECHMISILEDHKGFKEFIIINVTTKEFFVPGVPLFNWYDQSSLPTDSLTPQQPLLVVGRDIGPKRVLNARVN